MEQVRMDMKGNINTQNAARFHEISWAVCNHTKIMQKY